MISDPVTNAQKGFGVGLRRNASAAKNSNPVQAVADPPQRDHEDLGRIPTVTSIKPGIDSFDYLQFIIGLDEALGIQTAEEDYGKVETLRALLDYILKKKN